MAGTALLPSMHCVSEISLRGGGLANPDSVPPCLGNTLKPLIFGQDSSGCRLEMWRERPSLRDRMRKGKFPTVGRQAWLRHYKPLFNTAGALITSVLMICKELSKTRCILILDKGRIYHSHFIDKTLRSFFIKMIKIGASALWVCSG